LGVFLLFVVEGVCVRDCKGLGLCKVSIVGRLAGDECEGGRGNLVTDGGRMRGKGEAGGREWVRREQNKLFGKGVMDFSMGEVGRVKGVRVAMRR
jgi:hypothetical protein